MSRASDNEAAFLIGTFSRDYLHVAPLSRLHDADDYWDGNWLHSQIEVRVGGFSACYPGALRVDEFESFHQELASIYEILKGKAGFWSMEEWLSIDVKGDGRGHFNARCEATDEPGIGNKLKFQLTFDQTEIPGIIRGLQSILEAFPLRGSMSDRVGAPRDGHSAAT